MYNVMGCFQTSIYLVTWYNKLDNVHSASHYCKINPDGDQDPDMKQIMTDLLYPLHNYSDNGIVA